MRRAIETAPKDGKLIILEDDATGIYAIAHWEADRGEWVGKDRQPSKIVPTHWLSIERDDTSIVEGNEPSSSPAQIEKRAATTPPRRGWRKTTLIAAGLIGIYLFVSSPPAQKQIAPTSTSLARVVERHSEASTHTAAAQRNTESDAARQQPVGQNASAGESQQSLGEGLRHEALSNELAAARGAIKARDNQIETLDRQLRDQESELESVRRDVEAKLALLTELQQQHDRAETLAAELTTTRESARGAIEARDSQIEAFDRQLRDRESELASVRRDVEAKMALLTKLQQQRDRAETSAAALTETRESARGAIEARDSQIRALERQLRERESELALVRRDVEAKVALLTELQQQRNGPKTMAAEKPKHESAVRDSNAQIASERAANEVPIPPTQTVVLPALAEPGLQPTSTAPGSESQAIRKAVLLKNREPKEQAERQETTRKELRVERRQRYAERKARHKHRFFPTLSEPGLAAFYGASFFGNSRVARARLKQRSY